MIRFLKMIKGIKEVCQVPVLTGALKSYCRGKLTNIYSKSGSDVVWLLSLLIIISETCQLYQLTSDQYFFCFTNAAEQNNNKHTLHVTKWWIISSHLCAWMSVCVWGGHLTWSDSGTFSSPVTYYYNPSPPTDTHTHSDWLMCLDVQRWRVHASRGLHCIVREVKRAPCVCVCWGCWVRWDDR